MVEDAAPTLPDKCCSKCVFWSPNNYDVEQAEYGLYDCLHPKMEAVRTVGGFSCNEFTGACDTDCNVPMHTPDGTMNFKNSKPVDGPVEILIVSYWRDFPWLDRALQCIDRHASGFLGLTVVFPVRDAEAFQQNVRPVSKIRMRTETFPEVEGKGFLHHEAMMACADALVPVEAKFVLHMDSDSMMKMSNTPEDYFLHDKPIYLWRTWESLASPDSRNPTKKVVSDCAQWRLPTEAQLGYPSDAYTMNRHPTVLPVGFYKPYREHIERVHGRDFFSYMLAGEKNAYPQDRMDFTAYGQFAFTFMRDQFHWINLTTEEYPADRMKSFWSHGGLLPEIRAEIEAFLE